MKTSAWMGKLSRSLPLFLLASVFLLAARPLAAQLGPDSPEVKAAIDRGIAFLERSDDNRLGAKALVGLTFVKYGKGPEDPKIQSAVDAIKNATKGGPENFRSDIYSTGISIMFLVALDPSKYRDEIEVMVKSLHLRQKDHGAWGYPPDHKHGATCDTSMTQYAALGMWEAYDQAGVETPVMVWDRLAEWLIKTQAPDGGFGYQGNPSPSFDRRIKQDSIKHSMAAAAMGSLYICKDQLGLSELKKRKSDDTPSALKPYESPEERLARIKTRIDPRYFQRAIGAGNRWMAANYTIDKPKGWLHYYLYALERYESLKEAEQQKKSDRVPTWYIQGARFLIRTQKAEGSWESQAKAVPDTCFAILFLLRSTKKTLEKSSLARYEASLAVGGRGLPEETEVRVRDGKVVVKPLESASLAEIIEIVSDPEHPKFENAKESLADQSRFGDRDELASAAAKLAKLALSAPSEIRVMAINALSRGRNLDQAPLLIYLLNDPDFAVMRAARDALRIISRKFSGVGLGLRPSDEERQAAIEKWKAWYRTIRPDVDLESLESFAETL